MTKGCTTAGTFENKGAAILSEHAIREELSRVLASPSFARSPRMSRFLSFVVEETLSGRAAQIKEYVIALEVCDKQTDYDPRALAFFAMSTGRA